MVNSEPTIQPPLVSVIVPVYKAEAYLGQCVESILVQSMEDFELLLIDDGSPDGCGALCDDYARADTRVRAIHKENGGVSSARNLGIDRAAGRYIVFIDSDDHVGSDYLKELLDSEEEASTGEKKVLVISDYQPFSKTGPEERAFPEKMTMNLVPGGTSPEQFRELVFSFRIFPPYCKLYRADVIRSRELRFDTSIRTAEDFDFNRRYLEHVDAVRYIPSVRYHYRVGYKRYQPSNRGVLGQSEIKSAHIMANGIVSLAQKLDLMEQLEDEICLWAANKHYFNRLPMLFAESPEVGTAERYRLYRQLIADPVYRSAHKRGAKLTTKSTTRLTARFFDCFAGWWLFYKFNGLRR
ncbi:MAG: glycosyltransferase family 2 protein [Ruminococcaceae bacterium]|nr:glycosyltransferase family 2 protein [Oscillospiraceae bacterium]